MGLPPYGVAPGTVLVPLGPGDDLPEVQLYAASKTGTGRVPPIPPALSPLAAYAAASWPALTPSSTAFASASYTTTGYDAASKTEYTNTGTVNSATYTGLQYKLRVTFVYPWLGPNAIQFSWREKTTIHTGVTSAYSAPVTYEESASETYAALTETVTPAAGATFAETSVHTIDAPSLAQGATVTITGPSDTGSLSPHFYYYAVAQTAAKLGFLSYTVPETAPGALVNPQPIYTLETASTAPDAPSGTSYSGAQDTSSGSNVNTFSANVPPQYLSSANNAYPDDPFDPDADAMANIGDAVSVMPTVVQWPGSLIMTLSNLQDTSTITGPVTAALAAIDFATLFPTGVVAEQNVDGAIVAVRNLPAHEQWYTAGQGVYSAGLDVPIDGGVTSFYPGQPAPLTNSGSLGLSWTRETIDLDTGERSSTVLTLDVGFTGQPGSIYPLYDNAASNVGGDSYASPYYEEDVPSTNQRVEISGLTTTTSSLDCLAVAPLAQIVAPAT